MAKQFFPIQPFQEFIIAMLAGWRHKAGRLKGKRLYIEAYISMPKKNAKTALMAAFVAAVCFLEPDVGGQYMFAATSRKQANICFKATKKIITDLCNDDTDIASIVKIYTGAITRTDTDGSIFSVSKEAKSIEGAGGNVIILDEYHLQTEDDMKDNLQSGQSGRLDPLIVAITTAGSKLHTPCHTQYEYGAKVLDGIIEDDTFLFLVWEVDQENKDAWKDMAQIEMANPNIGMSPTYEFIKRALDTALNKGGSKESDFRTKHCNQWVNQASVWITDNTFMKCRKPSLQLLPNVLTYAGLDHPKQLTFLDKLL